jgi:S1-C subfamily serine protease
MKHYLIIVLLLLTNGLFAQSTSWNEYKLKEQWETNGIDEIEGIYENVAERLSDPKYKTALIKSTNGYNLIYLSGAASDDAWRWSVGDVKAYLTSTATPYLYKTKWFMGDKTISEELYITFESGFMKIIWTDGRSQLLYVKLYPTANDNIKQSGNQSKLSSGTGFGVSSNGIIVSNFHVIDGAKTIKVRGINSDFNKTYKANVLVADKNNDLVLIQIDDYSFTSLGTIPYTINTGLAGVGENIFVLGYPLRATMGDEIKLTNGIISSKTGFQGDITSYQISAPVQPGNSGGPLYDSKGNLIGIINAKHTGAENASYAVKTSYLTNMIDLLPSPPKLQTINSLTGKSLIQQVELAKKFVYIIETE